MATKQGMRKVPRLGTGRGTQAGTRRGPQDGSGPRKCTTTKNTKRK